MHFGKESRVRLARDFEFLKKNSTKADCSAFVFYLYPNAQKCSRLAVITSKKVGCAVERNLARRRFRAIFRSVSPNLSLNVDILVFVRRGYVKFDYQTLQLKFEKAAKELIQQHEKKQKKDA
ncbi:MAG: ribonuclease P protein component [Opitutales bacterium]|nr:ribonuclease P protein component [Opitutales bacterium]